MSTLFLGQNGTGKTENIKSYINSLEGRKIILDFSDEYNDITENVFLLDEINLLDSQLNYSEMKAINAGYLHDSHCLYRRSIDLIKETDAYFELKNEIEDTTCEEFKERMHQIQVSHLIDNTLERLHISWNKVECDYAKILNEKIPKKRSKNHIPLNEAIEKVVAHKTIRFQTKTMQSEHQRAVAFCLLARLSHLLDEPIYIIADDIASFFNNGNTKLFLEALNLENIHFICSFNKPSVLPKALLPMFENIYFHKTDNNASIKELTKIFNLNPTDKLVSNIRQLKIGQSEFYQPNKKIENTII